MNTFSTYCDLQEISTKPVQDISDEALYDLMILEPKHLRSLSRERIEAIAHRAKAQIPEVYRFCVRNFGVDMLTSPETEERRQEHAEDILYYLRVSQFEIHEHVLTHLQQAYSGTPLAQYLCKYRWREVMKRLLRDSKRPHQNMVPSYVISLEETKYLCEYLRSELTDETAFQQKEYDLAMGYARRHGNALLKKTLEELRWVSLSRHLARRHAQRVRGTISCLAL